MSFSVPRAWFCLISNTYHSVLVHHVSQTGCKLVAYTEFGLRHVNTALVTSILFYAWILVFYPQYDLDSMVIYMRYTIFIIFPIYKYSILYSELYTLLNSVFRSKLTLLGS